MNPSILPGAHQMNDIGNAEKAKQHSGPQYKVENLGFSALHLDL